jgi:enamine deaminase RidA (YjgF/YER057c/UK114 family)
MAHKGFSLQWKGSMNINTRRWFHKFTAMTAAVGGARVLFAQQPKSGGAQSTSPGADQRRPNGIHNGIFYFSGIGANSGYPKEDRVLVTDPFEKHVTRTMDSIKRSVERAGSTMDNLIHLDVFLCLPLADNIPMPTGKARFDAHQAQYATLNKIYGTYFSPGKAPTRSCMALEWIPGDSLIEIVGTAVIVNPKQAAG